MNIQSSIDFLKEFQKTCNSQTNDGNADPVFWAIMDYKDLPTGSDWADKQEFYHNNGDYKAFSNVKELNDFVGDLYEEFNSQHNMSFSDLTELILTEYNEDDAFGWISLMTISYIVPDTMFLTKDEAVKHLKSNQHHYTSKAHTYAMTAWRSPVVSELLRTLKSFDWVAIERTLVK